MGFNLPQRTIRSEVDPDSDGYVVTNVTTVPTEVNPRLQVPHGSPLVAQLDTVVEAL